MPATKIKHFICRRRLPFLLIAISFCFMAISFFSSAFDIPFVFMAPVDGSHSLFDRMNERRKKKWNDLSIACGIQPTVYTHFCFNPNHFSILSLPKFRLDNDQDSDDDDDETNF